MCSPHVRTENSLPSRLVQLGQALTVLQELAQLGKQRDLARGPGNGTGALAPDLCHQVSKGKPFNGHVFRKQRRLGVWLRVVLDIRSAL